tara:strand:+ start:750 stop:1529 length:780 start_codon:yes stop_codon:yes gene_type:complete
MHNKYTGKLKEKATSSKFLDSRLKLNKKLTSFDLHKWQFSKLKFKKNSNILDLGCGTGKQSLEISNKILPNGKIVAIDLSRESILKLKKSSKNGNIICLTDSIDNVEKILQKQKLYFQTVLSTYAIYYANKPLKVILDSSKYLLPKGKIYITVPNSPHGMVEYISKFTKIPKNVLESLKMGNDKILPFIKKKFKNVKTYKLNNSIKFSNFNDFYNLYKSTTYFDNKIKEELKKDFEKKLKNKKSIQFIKKTLMIEAVKK